MIGRITILLLTVALIPLTDLSGRTTAQVRVPPPLPTLLERAGEYVVTFQEQFAKVVGFERYRQEVHAPYGGEMVDLESEVFFVGIDDRHTWLTVRHVLTVNGRSVAQSSDSVIDVLRERGNAARLRELADASARHNIGSVQRNFNDPTLALLFLAPATQPRFRFSAAGSDVVDGVAVHRVAFDERERPTIIRDARSRRDAPASGVLLIADDGRVMRSELRVRVARIASSRLDVTYGFEPRLDMMVPLLMEEQHRTARPLRDSEVITGRATYSNYRRFETGGRILPPDRDD
jgi:hypothetical protein